MPNNPILFKNIYIFSRPSFRNRIRIKTIYETKKKIPGAHTWHSIIRRYILNDKSYRENHGTNKEGHNFFCCWKGLPFPRIPQLSANTAIMASSHSSVFSFSLCVCQACVSFSWSRRGVEDRANFNDRQTVWSSLLLLVPTGMYSVRFSSDSNWKRFYSHLCVILILHNCTKNLFLNIYPARWRCWGGGGAVIGTCCV